MVGRTPWSGCPLGLDALVPLPERRNRHLAGCQQADGGVGRGPGGPPHRPDGRLRPFPGTSRIPNAVMIYQAAIDESFPVADPPTHAARLRSADPAALAETVGYYQHRLY